jgi:transcriptional regulator with XRE-family HTH domain
MMNLSMIASQATLNSMKVRRGKATDDATIRAVLNDYRNNMNLTVAEVAKRHGIKSVTTIYRWDAKYYGNVAKLTLAQLLNLARKATSLIECKPIFKQARDSGFTLKAIADAFDTSPQYVSKIINS